MDHWPYCFLCLQIFYFIGFGLFCLESVVSIWVIQVSLYSTPSHYFIYLPICFLTVFIISNRFCFFVFLVWAASVYVLPRQWETRWAETRSSKRSPQSRRMIALCSILACVWNLHCFFPFSDSSPCFLSKKKKILFCLYFLYVNLCLFKKSRVQLHIFLNFFFFAFVFFLHYNILMAF